MLVTSPLSNEINSVGQLLIFPMQMYAELATWLNILSRLKPVVTEFKLNPTDFFSSFSFLVFCVFLVWVGKKSVLLATIVSRLWVLKLILDFFCLFVFFLNRKKVALPFSLEPDFFLEAIRV